MTRRWKWWVREQVQRVAPRLALSLLARRSWLHEREMLLLPMLAPSNVTAVDAGANKGVYLHHLARNFDRVVAFEPLPAMAGYLRRAAPRNAQVHAVALSDHHGEAVLSLPRGFNELGSIEPDEGALSAADAVDIERHKVAVRSLDGFGLDNVGFVKIDVEGHELAVLEGARSVIETWRPVVMVEVEERHRAGGVDAVRSFFADRGYDGFFLDGSRLRRIADFDLARDQNPDAIADSVKVGRYINNFIFIHASWSAERASAINRWLAARSETPQRSAARLATAIRRWAGVGGAPVMPRPRG